MQRRLQAMADYARRRSAVACDICRLRKSRCNGEKPSCGFCKETGNICSYRGPVRKSSTSKLETDVAAILDRLQDIESLLWKERNQQNVTEQPLRGPESVTTPVQLDTEENYMEKYGEFPFMTLKNIYFTSMTAHVNYDMEAYALQLEQEAQVQNTTPSRQHRFRIFQRHSVEDIIAAFMSRIHIWDPLFDEQSFTLEYLHDIKNTLSISPRSCLLLMVSAIGSFLLERAESGHNCHEYHNEYFEEAQTMLPSVMSSTTLETVQCLFLFNLYYAVHVKPFQAYEYLSAASLKIQNIVKRNLERIGDPDFEAHRRLYWSIFLHESELCVQLNFIRTGIGNLQDTIPLPSGHFVSRRNSSQSPGQETDLTTDHATCYLLAEIMMRKALTRSTFLVPNSPDPVNSVSLPPHMQRSCRLSFAPIVIAELESQLDTWREHLPPALNFPDDNNDNNSSGPEPMLRGSTPTSALSNYFQAQFHACKMTHQWPAVYEASLLPIDSGPLPNEGSLRAYEKFLHGYFKCAEACLAIGQQPMPHTYTLCCSMFVLSLAVLQISTTSALQMPTTLVYERISEAVERLLALLQFHALSSPSVSHFHETLGARLEEWRTREK